MKRNKIKTIKIAFAVIIIAILFLSLGELFNYMSIEYLYRAIQILISLSIALVMFLSEYLLYRYDHDEYSVDENIDNGNEEDDMRKKRVWQSLSVD